MSSSFRVAGFLAAALVAIACAGGEVVPGSDSAGATAVASGELTCGVGQPAVLTDSGIGALRVGTLVADVRALHGAA